MNKFSKVALLMVGLAAGAKAQSLTGVGYDVPLNEVTARLSLGANAVDVGAGLLFDNRDGVADDDKFQFSASGFFLGHLHDWGPVDTYFTAGGILAKLGAAGKGDVSIAAFAGFQPEVTLLDHIVLSTRFGLHVPLSPGFALETAGGGISITGGTSFKILF
jgi:hypothetical protein